MITIDKAFLQQDGAPDPELLRRLLKLHDDGRERLDRLHAVYEREHAITRRIRPKGLPNNRLSHDLPGYITTMAAGYLIGRPVTYAAEDEQAFENVRAAYDRANVDTVDAELAVDASVYGKGVELCYADQNAAPRVAQVDPRGHFVVYDDTVEHRALFGVGRRETYSKLLERTGEEITVHTAAETIRFRRVGQETPVEIGRQAHPFGAVPMVEYWNNAREEGDFEPVLSLIDAYDALQSDRMNDKQQFTDAIFVLKGVGALGVDDTEEIASDGETAVSDAKKAETDPSVRLRQTRTLFLPGDGADAQFVTKPDAESGNEVLRMSLKTDIHKLSMVPDMTDEEFAGNVSGVAMRFKLLGLEQLTNIKERWFREGLRSRLRLFAAFLSRKGAPALDAEAVQITFTRSLPTNELEVAQTLTAYSGMVPEELLLAQVPFVADAPAALETLKAERDEAARRQLKAFETQPFREDEQERGDRKRGE